MHRQVAWPRHLPGTGSHIPDWFGRTTVQNWVAGLHLTAESGPQANVGALELVDAALDISLELADAAIDVALVVAGEDGVVLPALLAG